MLGCAGTISVGELKATYALVHRAVAKNHSGGVAPATNFDKFVETLDVDGDGSIDFKEFIEGFKLSYKKTKEKRRRSDASAKSP